MLARDVDAWAVRSAGSGTGPVFFDRGIVDVLGYLLLLGIEPPGHLLRACKVCRYAPKVFIAPPWPAIYANDVERGQPLAEAVATHAAMVEACRRCGHELVELLRGRGRACRLRPRDDRGSLVDLGSTRRAGDAWLPDHLDRSTR